MPNWITNKIAAPPHVIRAMLDDGLRVDFDRIAPFPGPHGAEWDSINLYAERAAKDVCGVPLSDVPVIAALERANRERINVRDMTDDVFEQFVAMVRNWRACGYLHPMDHAKRMWGTKWNAVRSWGAPNEGRCEFETAWACPRGVLVLLSERCPEDEIEVTYADEDIGSNCGTFTLRAGQVIAQDIAPRRSDLDDAGRARWKAFAYAVTGRRPEEAEEP